MVSYFGAKSLQLVKFGLLPKKTRAPLTAPELAVRAATAAATRALRGTKGSVQKAKVKSGPMQVTVGPVSSVGQETRPGGDGDGGQYGTAQSVAQRSQ